MAKKQGYLKDVEVAQPSQHKTKEEVKAHSIEFAKELCYELSDYISKIEGVSIYRRNALKKDIRQLARKIC